MTVILTDIGGTHARFAVFDGGRAAAPETVEAARFPDLAAALDAYCAARGLAPGGTVYPALAANPGPDGLYRFYNRNPWAVGRDGLRRAGWHVPFFINDFAASARGAVVLPPEGLLPLRPGAEAVADRAAAYPRAILGPGTGLGLAYMFPLPGGRWHVQGTSGGHMLAAAATAEQAEILRLVCELRGGDVIAVPEDVASGRGLPILYRAVCRRDGAAPRFGDVAGLMAHPDDPAVRATWRLFHEFLGLFAHHAAITGHAFGGLYMDGGIVQALQAAGMLDMEVFTRFLMLEAVPSVKARMAGMPVFLIRDPYVALRGLAEIAKETESGHAHGLSDH